MHLTVAKVCMHAILTHQPWELQMVTTTLNRDGTLLLCVSLSNTSPLVNLIGPAKLCLERSQLGRSLPSS